MIGRKLGSFAAAAVLAASALTGIVANTAPAVAEPIGTVSNIDLGNVRRPVGITTGPDGNLWFTNEGRDTIAATDTIGRMTPAGDVTEFETGLAAVRDITVGPDGNLWFNGITSLGRITPQGIVTIFTDPAIGTVEDLAAGPDGSIWFTDDANDTVGRMTLAGAVTTFADPAIVNPRGITTGPDGALWFTNTSTAIGRITTSGVVSSFADPSVSSPARITLGPDGALWFANNAFGVGRVTTSGTFSFFSTGDPDQFVRDISPGPDGNLWFVASFRSIGKITPTGVIQNFPGTPAQPIRSPLSIAGGPDGAVWFTNLEVDAVARISTTGQVTNNYGDQAVDPTGIVTGPDGNLWITNAETNERGSLSRLTPSGSLTSFLFAESGQKHPGAITVGPDAKLYFAAHGSGQFVDISPSGGIGRSTTTGQMASFAAAVRSRGVAIGSDGKVWYGSSFSQRTFPPATFPASIGRATTAGTIDTVVTLDNQSQPGAMTTGPDGNMWFLNDRINTDQIGRVTPAGVLTTFSNLALDFDGPAGIVAGRDGNLWFTNTGGNSIGRITPAGAITFFTDPTISEPSGITKGPDDNLWFTNAGNDSIGRITATGVVTNFTAPTVSQPTGITVGPDDGIWFTNVGNDSIGRIEALAVNAVTMAAPANGASINAGAYLVAGATTDVNAVEFRVTGGALNDATVSGAGLTPYGWFGAWVTSGVAEGTYRVVAVATTTDGSRARSAPITVTIDHTAPATVMLVPGNGATVRGTAVLDADASDNVGVAKVEFRATGGALNNAVVGTGTLTYFGWIATWNTTAVGNGTYSIRSRAYDAAGNANTSAPITVRVQN